MNTYKLKPKEISTLELLQFKRKALNFEKDKLLLETLLSSDLPNRDKMLREEENIFLQSLISSRKLDENVNYEVDPLGKEIRVKNGV